MLGLFLAAQYIGILVLANYVDVVKTEETGVIEFEELPTVGPVQIERPDVEPDVSLWYIMAAILIGTVLVLLIIRFNVHTLWKLWFFLAVLITITISLAAFITGSIAFIAGFILAWLKIYHPNVYTHNLTELLVYSGLAAIFVPILNLSVMIILLLLISAYDMYAVWKSKHMVKMAKFQAKSGIFAGLLLPYKIPKGRTAVRKVTKKTKLVKTKIQTAVLGGGDIGFPLLFTGVVLKTFGMGPALIVPLFTGAALFGLLWFGQRKKFYPAMPFITIGCFVGLIAISLFF